MTNISAFSFGLAEIVLLFAVLQTLFLVMLLAAAPGRICTANRLLGLCLLALAIALTEFVLIESGVTARQPQLLGLGLPAWFILAPAYFLYARTLTGRPLVRRDALHLVPLGAGMLVAIPFYVLPSQEKARLVAQISSGEFEAFPLLPITLMTFVSFQMIGYFVRSYFLLEAYEKQAMAESASASILAAGWLKKLSIGFCVFVMVFYLAAAEIFLLYPYEPATLSPSVLSFGIAAFVFFVSWHMFRHPELFALYTPGMLPRAEPVAEDGEKTKYDKTRLAPEQITAYEAELISYMTEHEPWLDGELRLAQLAERLGMPAHHLSQVINVSQGCSFFDFINGHRIEHAKALLRSPGRRASILNVALESGFNSKASFNRVFRKEAGMTPSAYQKQAAHEKGADTGEQLAR